ncbi:hypothetical protein B0H14DRAFT_2861031 [Mycena olivaceomarginata]|nr:hypothetical protein B0H14DRAFT_2861031 [Mycena olivaceomarginata]
MPISFSVAPHTANSIELTHSFSAVEILATSCKDQHRYVEEILQCAFSAGAQVESSYVSGSSYVIAILIYCFERSRFHCQDSESLSGLPGEWICEHGYWRLQPASGASERELVICAEGSCYSLDFGSMSRQMVDLIEKNIIDPTLCQWVLPNFTTTTVNDTTVAAVLMMATLKQYFSYGFMTTACSIPRVTLEGEKSDWVDILGRLEKLKEYGMETIAWYHLLRPVISRFVAAFDAPASQDNVEFWQKVAHLHQPSSGRSYYSGWINTFNAFDKEGRWIGNALDKTAVSEEAPELMTAGRFWATYGKHVWKDLIFDSTLYHCVGTDSVPPAYAEVDVKLDDNGEKINCLMLVGMVGGRVSSSADPMLSLSGQNDTIHPVPGWWICTKKQNVVSAQEEEEAHMEEIMRDLEEWRKKRDQQLRENQQA